MTKEINWDDFNHLGHKFKPMKYSTNIFGWHKCLNCNVKIYIDQRSPFKDKLMCWLNDLFHTNKVHISNPIEEFNRTCAEMIIKNIIE